MKPNPVCWFEIYVQDMDRAKTFYEAVLGNSLEQLPQPEGGSENPDCEGNAGEMAMWAFPMTQEGYGAGGMLVKMPGMPSGGNSTLVYFSCEDCAVEAARIVPNGGTLIKEKFAIGPHGFIALANDTEGNMIGLHSMK